MVRGLVVSWQKAKIERLIAWMEENPEDSRGKQSRWYKMSTIKHSGVRSFEENWRNGVTRILVATSAWGMGINDRKVKRVVQ